MRFRLHGAVAVLAVLALIGSACAQETGGEGGGTPTAEQDLLSRIKSDGVIRVSTDPAYPPQSSLNEETGEFEGFDIDVAKEIAKRLGVEVEWVTPEWTAITSGGWSDRWDMSVGSMTVLPERSEVLYFTEPYYYVPAAVAVYKDNTSIQNLETDLDGKTIGVCGACTYEYYLNQTLSAPGVEYDFLVDDPAIKTYNTDTTALQDLYLGDGVRLDAVITSLSTLQGAVDKGKPIRIVGDGAILFYEADAVAFDKSASPSSESLSEEVNKIVQEMHADGTLSQLSEKWYDEDITSLPS
jgi:polar amino acid transport system substrate-binding protein